MVFLGAPGTGKGSQAKRLAEKYSLLQISTGEMLREEMRNDTKLGHIASHYLEKGELVPCDIIMNMINEFMDNSSRKGGFIFDGFPRTLLQAEEFDNLLKKIGKSINFVLYFHTSKEILIKRLMARRICSECGKDYNIITNPSRSGRCDVCQGEIVAREDDKEEVITKRMEVYESQTKVLIDYYKSQNKIHIIDSDRKIEDIYMEIEPMFHNHNTESRS